MKSIATVALGILLIGVMAGCGNNEEPHSDARSPLNLQVNVISTAKNTRGAFVDVTFPVHTQLGVGLIDKEGTSDYKQLSRYTLAKREADNSETWQVNSGVNGLFVSTTPALAIAYYPVTSTEILISSGKNSYITPTVLSNLDMGDLSKYAVGGSGVLFGEDVVKIATSEIDYMVGHSPLDQDITATYPNTTLSMQHAMAMVEIRIERAFNYFGDGVMTSFTIQNNPAETAKPLRRGTVNVLTNLFTPSTEEVSYTRSFTHYHSDQNATYNDRVGFFAFPATIEQDEANVLLTVDGKSYSTTNTTKLYFEAGKLTRLTVKVNASEVVLAPPILAEDWIDTDEHEFEIE